MSFINTTKYADDATLVALYGNSWRSHHSPDNDQINQLKGSVTFKKIQPGSFDSGIKNFYIEMTGKFTITTRSNNVPIRIQNINDAIYDCNVAYNATNGYINQPYLNSIVKRCFDDDVFIENASTRHDKYVYAVITRPTNTSINVDYRCLSPLYHEFFEAKEITGINDLNLRFNYNIFNLFKANMTNAAAGDEITAIALQAGENIHFNIYYDEVGHEIQSEAYTMQIPHYEYYEAKSDITIDSSAASNNTIDIDVGKSPSCPLRCYLLAAPNIRDETTALCNVIPARFVGTKWDLEGKKMNAYQSDGADQLLTNFLNCKNAGLKSEFMTWAARKSDNLSTDGGVPIDPISAINTLGSADTYVGTADNFRLRVKGTVEHDQLTNCTFDRTLQGVVIYEHPAVLSLSTVASVPSGFIFSLNGTHDQLVEIEMDDNDYLKSLEEAGLLVGGSKFGDFFKNVWKKIKSSKFISKALNWIGNDSKKYNSLLSMIPVVGQFVPQIQDIANKAAPMVESAGLGVNLF